MLRLAVEVWRDGTSDTKLLKALDEENRKLKKLSAESMLVPTNAWKAGSFRRA
jgi:hypothetical protein